MWKVYENNRILKIHKTVITVVDQRETEDKGGRQIESAQMWQYKGQETGGNNVMPSFY